MVWGWMLRCGSEVHAISQSHCNTAWNFVSNWLFRQESVILYHFWVVVVSFFLYWISVDCLSSQCPACGPIKNKCLSLSLTFPILRKEGYYFHPGLIKIHHFSLLQSWEILIMSLSGWCEQTVSLSFLFSCGQNRTIVIDEYNEAMYYGYLWK